MRRLAPVLFALAAAAQDVSLSNLVKDQVIQCDQPYKATVRLAGTASTKANGKFIEARVLSDGKPVPGFDWSPLVRAGAGRFSGELRGVPAGGPYRIEVRLTGTPGVSGVDGILAGDLWVLAGQSNMEGYGDLVDVQQPLAQIHSFDMADRWTVASEPLHWRVFATDPVHWDKNEQGQPERMSGDKLEKYMAARKKGAGLALPFAIQMYTRTGVPVGLIPCAHGGTSMDQWDPALKAKGGDSLYGSMLRRIEAAGGKVRGVLWYQGEADTTAERAPGFGAKFEKLVGAVRGDLKAADLPFYYVQLGRVVGAPRPGWNAVQEAQRKAEAALPKTGLVAAVDLGLDDGIHVGTADLKRLGRRIANLATRDLYPDVKDYAGLKRGPRPAAAKRDGRTVKVSFNEVNGSLLAEGRPAGFSIHTAAGEPLPLIYKVTLDGAGAVLHLSADLPAGAVLRYGSGQDPYCNLRDAADLAVPVFGPLPIE